MPDPTPYADLSDALVSLLALSTAPVAVQFARTPPAGIPRIEDALKGCMYLDTARYDRRVFHADHDNLAPCPGGRYYLGLGKPFDRLLDGSFPSGEFPAEGLAIFGNPAAVRETLKDYAILPEGQASVICYGPLDLVAFDPADGPVVVNVFCPAKTGMYLARAVTYESGGLVTGPVGPPTCASVMVQPVTTGDAVYTLGCFGFRRYVRIGVDEIVMGIPLDKLAATVANLRRLFARRPDIESALPLNEAEERPMPLTGSALGGLYQRMSGKGEI
jgi:uncharacterized protein (DUF169 family)